MNSKVKRLLQRVKTGELTADFVVMEWNLDPQMQASITPQKLVKLLVLAMALKDRAQERYGLC